MASPSSALPLAAAADRAPTLLLLFFTLAAAVLTVLFCCLDAVLKPRARTLLHGDGDHPPTPSPRAKRTLFWVALSRLMLAALLIASLFPALTLAIRFYRHPLSHLAPPASNRWVHSLVRRALVHYARSDPSRASFERADYGLSDRLLSPFNTNPTQAWTWRFVLALIALVSALGAILRLVPSRLPTRNLVAPIILLQPILWLLFAVPAAFVRPTSLPLDSSPLTTKWLDFHYEQRPTTIDETRFLYNWYVRTDSDTVQTLAQLPNITRSFCTQFNELLPSVPQTASTRQSLPRITTPIASHVLIVYTVGKPIGPDHYRAIAYTCLAVMLAAPVLVAQTLRSYILYPLFAFWVFIFVLFALLATPSVIRPIAAPFSSPQVVSFCGKLYNIHVLDATTKLIIRCDIAIFALTIFAAMLQGYRWVKLVEDNAVRSLTNPTPQPESTLVDDQHLHQSSPSLKPLTYHH